MSAGGPAASKSSLKFVINNIPSNQFMETDISTFHKAFASHFSMKPCFYNVELLKTQA
jgi:hypothetical protein